MDEVSGSTGDPFSERNDGDSGSRSKRCYRSWRKGGDGGKHFGPVSVDVVHSDRRLRREGWPLERGVDCEVEGNQIRARLALRTCEVHVLYILLPNYGKVGTPECHDSVVMSKIKFPTS